MATQTIIQYCAPTLAGLKTSNLFHYKYISLKELENTVKEKNLLLNEKGVFLTVLKAQNNCALILVYRQKLLNETLDRVDIRGFLIENGYTKFDIESCFDVLREHLLYKDFPHEIGVFLGYPLEDIKGFINNKGENSKCVGCWKVYGNVNAAQKTFKLFKKCTDIYCKRFSQGYDIRRLTVLT